MDYVLKYVLGMGGSSGKRKLVLPGHRIFEANPLVRLVEGKPDLDALIVAIINNWQDSTAMTADLLARSEQFHRSLIIPEPQYRVHWMHWMHIQKQKVFT